MISLYFPSTEVVFLNALSSLIDKSLTNLCAKDTKINKGKIIPHPERLFALYMGYK